MQEKIKKIPQQIIEFWKKLSNKQRTLLISIAAGVIFTIILFVWLFTRTTYEKLFTFEDSKSAAAAKTILEDKKIPYQIGEDGVTFSVDKNKIADAKMALGENDIAVTATSSKGFDYTPMFESSSISTTSDEKKKMYKVYLQNDFADTITKTIEGVKSARVQVTLADETTSILESSKENSCAVALTTTTAFDKDSAPGIATYLATSLGNSNTDNIRIINQNGDILFAGNDKSDSANLSSSYDYAKQLSKSMQNQVRDLLLKSNVYNDVEVAPHLDVDQSTTKEQDTKYYPVDGSETGLPKSTYDYENSNNYASGDAVGTDANGGETPTYNVDTSGDSSGNTNIKKNEFDNSNTVTTKQIPAGKINTEGSSIAIVLTRYKEYYEKDLKDQLDKDNQTFAQFKEANNTQTTLDVDATVIDSIAKATGISTDNISVTAYEVPLFYESDDVGFAQKVKGYLQYILALVVMALLVFVVFKGMKPVEVTEVEPELSVEALLATTKDNQSLDDIEFSDKSAAREQIEKFVDENPEAVAQLLRNWLNEDWE